MKRFTMTMVMVATISATALAQLAPWPVQKEYYGVLGHWRFNDFQLDAGSIVAQYKLNDTVAAWCAGFGTALELDGSNDYVDTNQTFQTTLRADFSVSLWIQPHDGQPATEQCLIGGDSAEARGGLGGDGFAVYLETDGRIYVEYCAGGYTVLALTEEPIFKDGEQNWHNVIVTLKEVAEGEQGIFIFVDGGLTSLDTDCNGAWSPYAVDFSAYTSSNNIFLGARDHEETADLFFDGRMDNVVIFNKALFTIEVAYIATTSDEDYLDSATTVAGSDKDSRNLTSQTSLYNVANTGGQVGGCFAFDGTNDYLYRADDSTFDFGTTSDFSVSFWAKWTQSAAGRFICKRNPSGNTRGWWIANLSTGEIRFAFHNGTSGYNITTTNTYRDGEWHHIVCTRDAGVGRKIYVDGVERASGSAESDNLTSDDELYLGCDQAIANLYAGSMDDLIIFDRALTATEADALHDRGFASMEMSNPANDYRFWEDVRFAIWQERWCRGSFASECTFPALAKFQTGGSFASAEFAIGELILSCNGEIYVNKVAKDSSPLASNLDPSTDSNWYIAASPLAYHHWDKLQERYVYDYLTDTWKHGHDWLPTQIDPYAQNASAIHLDGVQLPSPSFVTISDAVVQEYVDAFETHRKMFIGGETISRVSDSFKDWWSIYHGDAHDGETDPVDFSAINEFWGCNGSALDLALSDTGTSSYKFYLDATHPADYTGCENDPDWVAFHPRWYDGSAWHSWNEPNDGYVQAVWKRVPKYKQVSYNHAATNQPKMWMGDASQEPPGLYGKTYRDRYIRCTYSTREEENPTSYTTGGATSKTLAQVASDYNSQYGYYDDGWHNGSVTYDGSQMYVAIESCSDGTYTEVEKVDVAAMLGGSGYNVDSNNQNGVYGGNGSFVGTAFNFNRSNSVSLSRASSRPGTPVIPKGGVWVPTKIINIVPTTIIAYHNTGTGIHIPSSSTATYSDLRCEYIAANRLRYQPDPGVWDPESSVRPFWTHTTGDNDDFHSVEAGTCWKAVWDDPMRSIETCDRDTAIWATAWGAYINEKWSWEEYRGAPIAVYGVWYIFHFHVDVVENRTYCGWENWRVSSGSGGVAPTIRASNAVEWELALYMPNIAYFDKWRNEDGTGKFVNSHFPYVGVRPLSEDAGNWGDDGNIIPGTHREKMQSATLQEKEVRLGRLIADYSGEFGRTGIQSNAALYQVPSNLLIW
jgi:hypothetical protein